MTKRSPSLENPEQAGSAEFSLMVSRALSILSLFSPSRLQLSLAEISRETGLSKPSIMRFMQALINHGYVEREQETNKYRPGFEAFRVGSLFGGFGLRTIALPVMRILTDGTGFTTNLSILQNGRMVILAVLEGGGPLRFSLPIGKTNPLHSTSTGLAALAVLDDDIVRQLLEGTDWKATSPGAPANIDRLFEALKIVRVQGYAVSWEMTSPGVGSVASGFADGRGTLAGVLTIGFGTGQVEKADCARLGKRLVKAVSDLSQKLSTSADMLSS